MISSHHRHPQMGTNGDRGWHDDDDDDGDE